MRPLVVQTILAATDLDDSERTALQVAHHLATAAGARLHVLHVSSRRPPPDEAPRESAAEIADRVRDALRRADLDPGGTRIHVVSGAASQSIPTFADHIKADVIVLGPHRPGPSGRAHRVGGTALTVVTHSSVPCLVVSEQPLRLPLQKVLVPVDGSDTARGALIVGLSWASALRAPGQAAQKAGRTCLTGLHVRAASELADSYDTARLEEDLEVVRQQAGTWAGVAITGDVIDAPDPAAGIVEYARNRDFDLVVLGTRGLGLDTRERLGTVSCAVSEALDDPVLLVSPSVWTTHAASL